MKKIALYAALLCLSSSVFGYTLNGRKCFTSSDARFFYNVANGATCCLTASEQQSQIVSGINPWAIASFGQPRSFGSFRRAQFVLQRGCRVRRFLAGPPPSAAGTLSTGFRATLRGLGRIGRRVAGAQRRAIRCPSDRRLAPDGIDWRSFARHVEHGA